MPGPRYSGNGAAVINGQLYVAGGWTQVNPPLPHADLFVYDPPTNKWTSKASLSHLSGCGASGAIRGKLYVYTTCNGFSVPDVKLLDVYDPASDSWSSLAGPNIQHSQPAFGVINDKLYVAGGQNNSTNVATNVLEVYDPLTNAWTTLAPMPTAVFDPASVALNGLLWVIGGSNGTTNLQIVQVYDPHKNTWPLVGTAAPLRSAGATVAYGIIFLEGGFGPNSTIGSLSTNFDLFVPPSVP